MKHVLRPLFDRIVIKELEPERMRQSGLVVPAGTNEPPPQQGIVLAVGQGVDWWEHAGVSMPVKPGDHVVFPASAGVWVEVDEERLLVCRVGEILGVLDEVRESRRLGRHAHVVRATVAPSGPRLTAVLRGDDERVTPLELFFDLVFVLAITQCTALMAARATWEGLAQGPAGARGALVVVGRLRLADQRGRPRGGRGALVMFAAMAALLVVGARASRRPSATLALCSRCAYGVVRVGADRAVRARQPRRPRAAPLGRGARGQHGDRRRAAGRARRSRTASLQGALWALALALDMGGPYFFGSEGWKLVPATSPSATG